MTTPLFMLFLMIAPYVAVRAWSTLKHCEYDSRSAVAIGFGSLFTFTGIGHFIQTEAMAQMLPPWVPERVLLLYVTGVLEFLIAAGFFIKRTRQISGWAAVLVLVFFFPANIYAALNRVPMGGHEWGPVYLLVRAPVQIIILLWVYWFSIRRPNNSFLRNRP